MSSKNKNLLQIADKKINRLNTFLRVTLLMLSVVVAYDAIVHKTPLYYFGFYLAGFLIGKVFNKSMKIEFDQTSGSFSLTTGILHNLITVSLLLFRFVIGKYLLTSFDVIFVSDALSLFFIGINYAKWRTIITKIDNAIYSFAVKQYHQ